MTSPLDTPNSQASLECTKSELDIFSVPHTQTSVVEGSWDTIYPYPDFELGSTIRFDITGTNTHYINLAETELHMCVHVEKKDKTAIVATDKVGISNNVLHSLFEQVQVYLNNVNVENSNRSYNYRAYVENLLCYSKEAKQTILNRDGWAKDTAGAFNSFDIDAETEVPLDFTPATGNVAASLSAKKSNKGWNERRNQLTTNQGFQVAGRLHCDIFNTNKYLLNNVDLRIVLIKASESFILLGDKEKCKDYRIRIDNCFLKIRRVAISPSVMLAHALALEKTTAKYPIKRVITKFVSLPSKVNRYEITAIHTGIMPTRLVCWFVRNEAHSGAYEFNPYNFENIGIKEIGLKIANKPAPYSTVLKTDFTKKQYAEAYLTLFKNVREAPMDISYKDYANGYCIFAFDLTPDLCSSEHYSLLKDGSLDLSILLDKALDDNYFVYNYMEFDNIIEITKERNIIFDYKI